MTSGVNKVVGAIGRWRLRTGIVAAVLGIGLVAPTSASAAGGVPLASHTFSRIISASSLPATSHVLLEFYGAGLKASQGPELFVGWARIRLKDPTSQKVFREVTTGDVDLGSSKTENFNLSPGTGISIDFFADTWSGTIADTQELTTPTGFTLKKCYIFHGTLLAARPPEVSDCGSGAGVPL